jgi:hypothetical protein
MGLAVEFAIQALRCNAKAHQKDHPVSHRKWFLSSARKMATKKSWCGFDNRTT